jgi:hypothetical protein
MSWPPTFDPQSTLPPGRQLPQVVLQMAYDVRPPVLEIEVVARQHPQGEPVPCGLVPACQLGTVHLGIVRPHVGDDRARQLGPLQRLVELVQLEVGTQRGQERRQQLRLAQDFDRAVGTRVMPR